MAVSPRLELFPLALGLGRALRISQAPAGVRSDTGITTADLLSRVRARFPGLTPLDETTYVDLAEALVESGFPLVYDHARRRFFPQARDGTTSRAGGSSSVLTSTSSLYAAAQGRIAEGRDPREVLSARLTEACRRGGFLALTLKGAELPGVADALAQRYSTTAVPLSTLFLDALKELAEEHGVRWQALLKADAKYTATGTMGAALASYTRLAAERVRELVVDLAEGAGPRSILLVHEAGLVARYWEAGGRELLAALQQSGTPPHGHSARPVAAAPGGGPARHAHPGRSDGGGGRPGHRVGGAGRLVRGAAVRRCIPEGRGPSRMPADGVMARAAKSRRAGAATYCPTRAAEVPVVPTSPRPRWRTRWRPRRARC